MIRGKLIAWIAAIGSVVALCPVILAIIVFDTPVLPRSFTEILDICRVVGQWLVALSAAAWGYSLWCRRHPRFRTTFSLAFITSVVADLGFGTYARVQVLNQDIVDSLWRVLYYSALLPLPYMLFIAPFLFWGWLGASVAQKRGLPIGIGIFAIGALPLCYLYLIGHFLAYSSHRSS